MSEYNMNDIVKYVTNNNDVKEGSIVRYLRNGSVIIKNEKKEEKIKMNNIVGNVSVVYELIEYTKNLEMKYNHKLEFIKQLECEIEEIYYISKFIIFVIIIFGCICPLIIYMY